MSVTHANPPQLPTDVDQYLETGEFGEDGMLKQKDGNLVAFTTYMTANWSQVLDYFDTVAPTPKKKLLVVAACEALSPADYLLFLQKLVQLSQSKNLNEKVLSSVLAPTNLKEGFLAYNYQNQKVRAIIDYISSVIATNDSRQAEIQKIISGQAKDDFWDFNAAYNNGDTSNVALP